MGSGDLKGEKKVVKTENLIFLTFFFFNIHKNLPKKNYKQQI